MGYGTNNPQRVVVESPEGTGLRQDVDKLTTDLAESTANANSKEINALYPPVPLVALKGDGTTDDTTALQNIINSLTIGTVLFPPNKTYLVGDVILKAGITLTTRSNRTAGYSSTNGMACLKAIAGATFILKGIISGYSVSGIFFNGNGKLSSGISGGMSSGTIENNVFYQCDNGFGGYNGGYARSSTLKNNTFKECNYGVTNIMDSRVIDNFFYSNNTGVYLTEGSNDNMIALNKVEWNNNYGINGYKADHNRITENIVDRNGKSGVKLSQCKQCRVSGTFRRNGATATSDADNCHVQLDSCADIKVDIETIAGAINDDGTGGSAPKYSLWMNVNDKVNTLNSDLQGCTTSETFSNGNTNSINKDTIRNFDRKTLTINAGVVSSLTLTGGKTTSNTFSRTFKKIKVVGRNTSSAVSYYGEKILIVKRESAGASIELAPAVNYFGSLLDGGITLTNFTTDTTGSYITFDVTNTTGTSNYQLTFELTD